MSYVDGALTIGRRPITVTADTQTKVYGNVDPALTYQLSTGSLVNGDSLSGALTRSAGENVGSYTISASALANGNYLITANNGALAISQRPITVTADTQTKVYGNVDPALTYQLSTGSLVNGDSLSGALTRSAGENVGSYTINASALANGNYLITANNGALAISQRPITVTADGKRKEFGNLDPALTYQVTLGNLVGSDKLTGALTRSAGESVGSYTINASALANGNYLITANNGVLSIAPNLVFDAAIGAALGSATGAATGTTGQLTSLPTALALVNGFAPDTQSGVSGTSNGLSFVEVSGVADQGSGSRNPNGFTTVFVVGGGINMSDDDTKPVISR